jgi:hypothetical protein
MSIQRMVYGERMVYGVWCMVHGAWCILYLHLLVVHERRIHEECVLVVLVRRVRVVPALRHIADAVLDLRALDGFEYVGGLGGDTV